MNAWRPPTARAAPARCRRGAAPRGHRRRARGGRESLQHPQHHVRRLEAPARDEERACVVLLHRPGGRSPRRARSAPSRGCRSSRARCRRRGPGGRAGAERVHRLPHLRRDRVAQRARPRAPRSRRRRSRPGSRTRVVRAARRRRAGPGPRGLAAPMISEQRVPRERDRGGIVGAALEVRVEEAVEHARGVLGTHEVTAEPVQVVGYAREHRIRSCCCCCCCPRQPAWRAGQLRRSELVPLLRCLARRPRPQAPMCPSSRRPASCSRSSSPRAGPRG